MKRLGSSFIIALLLSSLAFAQEQETEQAQTLFDKRPPLSTKNIGGFVAPAYSLTALDGGITSLFHIRGGMTIKDRFSFGAYYATSLNEVNVQSETIQGIYMDYWSVGGFAEYTLLSKKLFHVAFPLYLGYGEVEMDNDAGAAGLGEANFFQVEPAALLEVNIHKYVRFNIGAGYRFAGPMEYRNFDQYDIWGVTGYAGFKFGFFR